jgi:outer membrane lipoprotein-sorting protein
MKLLLTFLSVFILTYSSFAQNEEALLQKVKAKMEKVNDYEAAGVMKLDVSFIKAPDSKVTIFFKNPISLR